MGLFSNNVTVSKTENGVETKIDYYQYSINKFENIDNQLKTELELNSSLQSNIEELKDINYFLVFIIVLYMFAKAIKNLINLYKKNNSQL